MATIAIAGESERHTARDIHTHRDGERERGREREREGKGVGGKARLSVNWHCRGGLVSPDALVPYNSLYSSP